MDHIDVRKANNPKQESSEKGCKNRSEERS
jgi:hypothetical protein